ncbi:MAG: hypothetical protein JWO46_2205 [Nocardioidaceae bacterium]|nr:hypothetical protein [Nocardioidaceae bacterium]
MTQIEERSGLRTSESSVPEPPPPGVLPPATADEPAEPERGRRSRGLGSIQTKLLMMLLVTAVLATVVVGFFGYRSGTTALRESTYSRLQEVGDERLKAIQDFVDNQEGAVVLDSQGVGVQASKDFNAAYQELGSSTTTPAQDQQVSDFYTKTFVPRLEKNTGESFDVDAFLPTLPARKYLQASYTAFSADPDASIQRDDAGDGSAWTAANKRWNPYFRSAAQSLGLDDVLILDNDGNVVYSAYKGSELGSNVTRGEYRGGGLEAVYDDSIRSNSRDHVSVADFESYVPSYGAPTAFIASPIGTAGNLTGVLVYEVSSEKINAVLSGTPAAGKFRGLGTTGEAYLVGPDGTLRSDSRVLVEHPTEFRREAIAAGNAPAVVDRMVRTKQSMLLLKDSSTPAVLAGKGQKGTIATQGFLGHDVLASYQPANVDGLDWSLVTKIDSDEALQPVSDFARNILIATALVILLVCGASVLMARVFTTPLNALVTGVRAVAGGRLGAQVDAGRRKDEFGDLGAAFNDMSSSLLSKQELLDAQLAENHRLLSGLMPAPVAERYRGGETDISAEHDDVSVVYTQIDGFDAFAGGRPAAEARGLLSALAQGFDDAAKAAGIEKVRSVGAGYVASSGLVVQRVDHARRVVDFALAVAAMVERFNSQHGSALTLRAGVDSGGVRSGLVGSGDVVYDLWGEAVELAYRVRGNADRPGIYVTERVKQRLGSGFVFEQAGSVTEADATVSVWKVAGTA